MPKPHDSVIRKFVSSWLKKDDSDLQLAEYLLDDNAPFYEAIAFHCQQAAEKYLKAFLANHQVEFPKTHNLPELLELMGKIDKKLAKSLQPIVALNPYGVMVRYPDDIQRVDRNKADVALILALKTSETIHKKLKS